MTDQYEITVVIPTYNRAPIVEKAIEALGRQTIKPGTYEIVVADDGSTDDTKERTARAASRVPCGVTYLHQANTGANAARNKAVRHARGRLLLFINDDTIATPEMLERHLESHEKYPDGNAGVLGKVVTAPQVPYSLFARLHLERSYELWDGRTKLDWRAFYTCNVSVKKDFLLEHGLFEESMRYHEDVELSERLSRYGFYLIYDPEALAYHDHFLTEDSYLNAARMDGKALAQWHRKAPDLTRELAFFGFPDTSPLPLRMKHRLGDMVINRTTLPAILKAARFLSGQWEGLATYVYSKVYQAVKREATRNELQAN